MTARFGLGRVVATPAALELCQEHGVSPLGLIGRHHHGDWGDCVPEDKRANEQALRSGARLLSVYRVGGVKLYLITDGETDACPACEAGIGECEPDKGSWHRSLHFRDDLPLRRLSTTLLRADEY